MYIGENEYDKNRSVKDFVFFLEALHDNFEAQFVWYFNITLYYRHC